MNDVRVISWEGVNENFIKTVTIDDTQGEGKTINQTIKPPPG